MKISVNMPDAIGRWANENDLDLSAMLLEAVISERQRRNRGRLDDVEGLGVPTGPGLRPDLTHEAGAVSPRLPHGRHGLPRHFVVRNQRGRLIDAAMHVFGTRSFSEARVADVVERAAISRKTFYEHFADMEACFVAAYEAAAGRVCDAVREAARAEDDWDASVRAGIDALLGFLAGEPALARLLVVEVTSAGPTALRRRNDALCSVAALLARTRDEDAALSAQVAVGGIWQVIHAYVLEGRAEELPKLADALYECVRSQIGDGGRQLASGHR